MKHLGISVEGIQELCTLVNQKLYQNKNLKINSISTYICMVFLSGRIHTKLLTSGQFQKKVKESFDVLFSTSNFILELKNSITETKKVDQRNTRVDVNRQRKISTLEDRAMSAEERKKNKEKQTESKGPVRCL